MKVLLFLVQEMGFAFKARVRACPDSADLLASRHFLLPPPLASTTAPDLVCVHLASVSVLLVEPGSIARFTFKAHVRWTVLAMDIAPMASAGVNPDILETLVKINFHVL